MTDLTGGLVISEWIWTLVHGSPKLSERVTLKAGVTDATLVARIHLELAKTLDAVLSGVGRLLAQCTCFAGAGLAGRAGFASAAIKKRSLGVNFL